MNLHTDYYKAVYGKTKCDKCNKVVYFDNRCLCGCVFCDSCYEVAIYFDGHAYNVFDPIKLYCCSECCNSRTQKHNKTAIPYTHTH